MLSLAFVALALAASPHVALAQTGGSWTDGGNTLVSAMMMFLGNDQKVYILDKAEDNMLANKNATINGHTAWGSVWDFNTHESTAMDVYTNTFCSSGMHLPNGSFVTFGGNGAIGPGGNIGSVFNASAGSATYDATYQDYTGGRSIRILNPCTDSDDWSSSNCQWFDNPQVLAMQKTRWYSSAEALADGSVVIIGGFVNGGYVNRNLPNVDPTYEGGAAEPTYEFYPSKGPATNMQFMTTTSGLNAYAHAFLMPSGDMFVQANLSTIMWNYTTNVETPLPDMPNGVVRVYPASGAAAVLPLTPENNWTPTVMFCGGSNMSADDYGNYSFPAINTWDYPASTDCQTITPEPQDGSSPVYTATDDLPAGRTMGQFILLPDQTMLIVNGGANGTAGYSNLGTFLTDFAGMPYAESLAAGPVLQPAIYDSKAAAGSRWTTAGLSQSKYPRLYHSSAILLPDASVLIAGSNPNIDVNTTAFFPTTYAAEIFYPPYFSASTRPVPSGIPSKLTYGGNPFDVLLPASSYSGSANAAAANTTVVLIRGGWTTHGMNMGQRLLQLNNTYTVNSNGSITLHVAQVPPNPNVLTPGPALFFVVVDGIPSNGTMILVGSGDFGTQPTQTASVLPDSVQLSSVSGTGSGSGSSTSTTSSTTSHTGTIIGGIVAAIAIIGAVGALFGIIMSRRRRAAAQAQTEKSSFRMNASPAGAASAAARGMGMGGSGSSPYGAGVRTSDSSAFVPLQHENRSSAWASTASLNSPYRDDHGGDDYGRPSMQSAAGDYDPYSAAPRTHEYPRY